MERELEEEGGRGWRRRREGGRKEGGGRREGGGKEKEALAQSPEVSTSHCQGQMAPYPPQLRFSGRPPSGKGHRWAVGLGSSWSNCCLGPNPGSCFSAQLSHHLSGYPNPPLGTRGPQRSRGLPLSIPQTRNRGRTQRSWLPDTALDITPPWDNLSASLRAQEQQPC